MSKYDPKQIEQKWQKSWLSKKVFEAKNNSKKQKKYVLFEFPYPSGAGLHVGHMRPYVASDIVARYFRLKNFEVLYPMGWDAFGLPAENFAIKNKVHPSVSTKKNIANAKKQMQMMGLGLDWSREINTTDPEYYKWSQKIFLEFFKAGLAYEKFGEINWCPKDKTGLANEEVIDGKCERCGTAVEKKNLRQWYLKITDYAESLLEGLKDLSEWPEMIKTQQENWIGKSEGAEIEFRIKNLESRIKVFTTRADTLFGVTYVVLAPEHELVAELLENRESGIKNRDEIQKYINNCKNKTEEDRTNDKKEKTGVEIQGLTALNPVNNEEIPVWVADYVLGNYGTGAVMAVPAHDDRDLQFAKKYNLKIKPVIARVENFSETQIPGYSELLAQSCIESNYAITGEGTLINSGQFSGLSSEEARKKIVEFVVGKNIAKYKLRDWVFSRQRYWGEPIPLIHCERCGIVPVPEKDLPVKLPAVKNYEPTGTGESPLANIKSFVDVPCPKCKGKAKRETNTMPQWAGSSWYWLRYMDPKNKSEFSSIKAQKYWAPVDLYFGGMEHTTLHLLYSRFWNQFLFDRGLVTVKEPYKKRVPHGIILGPDGEKMSKSRGNVVNPDELVKLYGADTVRLYMMFLGPHGAQVAWNDKGIVGARRFIEKVFGLSELISKEESKEVKIAINKTIKKVGEDIETFAFNTAVSSLMICVNTIVDEKQITKESYKKLLITLAPFIPHTCEELWAKQGDKKSIFEESFPQFDEGLIAEEKINIAVQVNGKTRAILNVSKDISDEDLITKALKDPKIEELIKGQKIKKTIVIKGKIVSLVV